MQQNAVSLATHGVADAMRGVAGAVYALRPPEPDHVGARLELRSPWDDIPGMELALRMCRTVDEEGVWHGLGELLKRVPEEYTALACLRASRTEVLLVWCPCGARVPVPFRPQPCPGDCGRWFAGDRARAAWTFRLPEQEVDDDR